MSGRQPDRPRYRSCIVRLTLIGAFTTLVVCGGMYLVFYFGLGGGYEFDRAVNVAELALGDIWQLSEQVREVAPEGANLTNSQDPNSHVYRTALSAGSPQYASASAWQNYSVQSDLNTIMTHYDRLFTSWGWSLVTLEGDTGSLKRVYQHPDNERLMVGLCQPESTTSLEMTQYRVFFDFDEIPENAIYPDAISKFIYGYCRG